MRPPPAFYLISSSYGGGNCSETRGDRKPQPLCHGLEVRADCSETTGDRKPRYRESGCDFTPPPPHFTFPSAPYRSRNAITLAMSASLSRPGNDIFVWGTTVLGLLR